METDARRYLQVPYPWRASIGVESRWPGRFYARLVSEALRYGNPARRRWGAAFALAGRVGLPTRLTSASLRLRRRVSRPDVDALIAAVRKRWDEIKTQSSRLPEDAPALAALALERSSAVTIFLFGDGPDPLLVCKLPYGDGERVDHEARALQEAEPAHVGPRFLGRVGDARIQEAVVGRPMRVEPVKPASASSLEWAPQHTKMGEALISLAANTNRDGVPQELSEEILAAAEKASLEKGTARLLRGALDDLTRTSVSVLRHGDTSAQNCLFIGDDFAGLVDWELARFQGAAGFDTWNAAVAWLDHGVGLVRWSEHRALDAFTRAWNDSSYFQSARQAARRAAEAAGVPSAAHDQLEVAFFGRRLASRLARPGHYATGPETAARMLEFVCGR